MVWKSISTGIPAIGHIQICTSPVRKNPWEYILILVDAMQRTEDLPLDALHLYANEEQVQKYLVPGIAGDVDINVYMPW